MWLLIHAKIKVITMLVKGPPGRCQGDLLFSMHEFSPNRAHGHTLISSMASPVVSPNKPLRTPSMYNLLIPSTRGRKKRSQTWPLVGISGIPPLMFWYWMMNSSCQDNISKDFSDCGTSRSRDFQVWFDSVPWIPGFSCQNVMRKEFYIAAISVSEFPVWFGSKFTFSW